MISVDQALDTILSQTATLAPQNLPLKVVTGLRLAEPVISKEANPSFTSSAMDGYALGSLDKVTTIVGSLAAGEIANFKLNPGQCCRILTGAVIPEGSLTVVPQEEVRQEQSQLVCLSQPILGQHLRPAGEHFSAGESLLKIGETLNSASISLAAMMGYPHLTCVPPARVSLIATGDELLELDQVLGPAQVRNSNLYGLEAQVKACNARPRRLPIVPDLPQALRQVLEAAWADSDVILTCGGASVGDRDYVQSVLQASGADLQLWKIAMRPGKPLGFALLQGKPVIALPGNPVACYVTFELFVRPMLDKLQGGPGQGLRSITAKLATEVHKKSGLRFFLRCRLEGQTAYPLDSQASHLFRTVVESDGLMELSEETTYLPQGTSVKVLLWPWVNLA